MTARLSPKRGQVHEIDQSVGVLDTRKDLINNDLGIEVATATPIDSLNELKRVLADAARTGYLACAAGDSIVPCGNR